MSFKSQFPTPTPLTGPKPLAGPKPLSAGPKPLGAKPLGGGGGMAAALGLGNGSAPTGTPLGGGAGAVPLGGKTLSSVPTAPVDDGIEWGEKYPIYAPAGPLAPKFNLIKFLTGLPTVQFTPKSAANAAATNPAPTSQLRLAFPFSGATRLCTPRHQDIKRGIMSRKRQVKVAAAAAKTALAAISTSSTPAAAAAAASAAATKEEEEGIDPQDRKWRLEDPKQLAKDCKFQYYGTKELPIRKAENAATSSHYAMLIHQDGKFLLAPYETYMFSHDDGSEKLTLEEAEEKMKKRTKRFEKRVARIANLAAGDDEDDGSGALGIASSGGGGSRKSTVDKGDVDGNNMERARPSNQALLRVAAVKTRTEDDLADDPFADLSSRSSGRVNALQKKVKIKREEGADYTRQFDDDDLDERNDDRLDGQGGEVSDADVGDDDEEALLARQEEVQTEVAAMEKKRAAALTVQKVGADVSMEEVEEAQELDDIEHEFEDENPQEDDLTVKKGANAKGPNKEEDSDFSDSDLSLDDSDDEEEKDDDDDDDDGDRKESSVKVKAEPSAATSAAVPANRKRAVSPNEALGATKKIKVEGGAAAPVVASAPAAAAAASGPVTAEEIAEIERLLIKELLASAPGQFDTTKSVAIKLGKKYPAIFNKRTLDALRGAFTRIVSLAPDKKSIILKPQYHAQATAAASSAPNPPSDGAAPAPMQM